MRLTPRIHIVILFFCVLSFSGVAFAGNTLKMFSMANQAARAGKLDFAFMHYRSILRDNPTSPYTDQALFALGEYLYIMTDYNQARDFFSQYLESQSQPEGKLFALVYLLKMALSEHETDIAQEIEKEILLWRQQTYIFKKVKEYSYRSPLFRKHKAVYSIDKIEFYIENEPFAKVSY